MMCTKVPAHNRHERIGTTKSMPISCTLWNNARYVGHQKLHVVQESQGQENQIQEDQLEENHLLENRLQEKLRDAPEDKHIAFKN